MAADMEHLNRYLDKCKVFVRRISRSKDRQTVLTWLSQTFKG